VTFIDVLPEITVSKTANPTSVPETGGDVTFTFVVTNNGPEAVTITALSDDQFGTLVGDDDCKVNTVLAVGASCEFSIVRTISGVFGGGDHVNVFSAAATDNEGNPATDTDDATVTFTDVTFGLTLTKTVAQQSYSQVGELLTYKLVAQNVGNGILTNVTIHDPKLGDLTCQPAQPATLQPSDKLICEGSYLVTQGDLDAGHVINTAVADSEETAPVEDSETVPAVLNPALTLVKHGDAGPVTIGDMIHYTITVKNTGNVTLHDVIVTDAKLGINENIGTLAVGESKSVTGSYGPVKEADLPGPIFNTAGATGTPPVGPPTPPVTDTHEVPVTSGPALSIVKTGDAGPVTIGDMIHYTITVKNTGNVTLHDVIVTDAKLGINQNVGMLTPGQSAQVTGSYGPVKESDLPGPIFNTAIGTGTTPEEKPVGPITGTHEVPLVIAPKLTLVKSVTPTIYSEAGDVIHYNYKLTNAGNVTLYAPFKVSDNKTTVTCPAQPASLAPGESITCTATYVITEADVKAEAVTNVAQGTAKDPQGGEVISNQDEETVIYVLIPTSLPPIEQPDLTVDEKIFLPTLKRSDAEATPGAAQVQPEATVQEFFVYLPTVVGKG
jgi:hypothetical protein